MKEKKKRDRRKSGRRFAVLIAQKVTGLTRLRGCVGWYSPALSTDLMSHDGDKSLSLAKHNVS